MLPLTNPPVLSRNDTQLSSAGASVHPLKVAPMVTPSNRIPGNSSNPENRLPSAQAKLGATDNKPATITDVTNFIFAPPNKVIVFLICQIGNLSPFSGEANCYVRHDRIAKMPVLRNSKL